MTGCLEKVEANDFVRSVVDTERKISKVSMNVQEFNFIRGVRLIDENGDFIIDDVFCSENYLGDWVTHTIPKNHRIIGINLRGVKQDYDNFKRIGIALWKPNPRALD